MSFDFLGRIIDHMMRKIIQNLIPMLSTLSFFSVYGCAAAVIGMGAAGGGAFAYFNGKLKKTYESEYNDTVQACSNTLERLKIPVTEIITDDLKTDIKAKLPDDTPVAIEVVRIDADHTQVSVRTGSVGVWDRRVSEQIHGYINETLIQKIVDDEEPTEVLSTGAVQPAIDEVLQSGNKEEDLAENSAPAPVPVEASTYQKLPESGRVIFFEQNSIELSDTAIEKLNRISEIMINNPAAELELNGYSDSSGARSYNLMLSEVRAIGIKSYLVGKGIEVTRIRALGHGARKFIASNKSAEGRRLNRRVEIELTGNKEEDLAENSAPAPVPVEASTYQKLPESGRVIFFEQNSIELSDTAIEKLNRISEIMINNPAAELELNGYSDSSGARSYNLMLSEVRAIGIKSYLVGKGIEVTRIRALGHGARKFIASNKSAEGRRLNCVEIELINP